jgi:hypothetical protein
LERGAYVSRSEQSYESKRGYGVRVRVIGMRLEALHMIATCTIDEGVLGVINLG